MTIKIKIFGPVSEVIVTCDQNLNSHDICCTGGTNAGLSS